MQTVETTPPKRRGRKAATGRYESHALLVEAVWAWWGMPGVNQAQIARVTQVSAATVASILSRPRPK